MAQEVSRKQAEIYEIKTDDGGVGLLINGTLHMGYDMSDLTRLVCAVWSDGSAGVIDGDLLHHASHYINGDEIFQQHMDTLLDLDCE